MNWIYKKGNLKLYKYGLGTNETFTLLLRTYIEQEGSFAPPQWMTGGGGEILPVRSMFYSIVAIVKTFNKVTDALASSQSLKERPGLALICLLYNPNIMDDNL